MKRFGMIERAVREIIEGAYEPARGRSGGSPSFEAGDTGIYVWIAVVPGGSATLLEGEWIVDIDVLAPSYGEAMDASLDLEPILIGTRHRTAEMRIDTCRQNEGPSERPWDDDEVVRVGATYVFTARRSS